MPDVPAGLAARRAHGHGAAAAAGALRRAGPGGAVPTCGGATGAVDLVHVTVPMRVGIGDVPMVATVHDLFPLTRPEDFTPDGAPA